MAKRTYTRRTEAERIAELQKKIEELESKMESEQRPDGEVLKQIPKVKRSLGKFAQLCIDNRRPDLSNSALAFLATLERQAQDIPDEMRARMQRKTETSASS